jgi:glyoxylase-like metal-dependent hydrolase (beta-lactamase superfamily II)
MNAADYVINQLGKIGLQPDDIQFVVCTHFDPDYAGNHELFTNAELIVQRRHYALGRSLPSQEWLFCSSPDRSLEYEVRKSCIKDV